MNILVVTSSLASNAAASNHICDRIDSLKKIGSVDLNVVTKDDFNNCYHIGFITGVIKSFKSKINHIYNRSLRLAHRIVGLKGQYQNIFCLWKDIPYYERAILEEIRFKTFDIIYSTGRAEVHIAVYNVLLRFEKKIRWIAELQDPLIFNGITGRLYKASDLVMFFLNEAEKAIAKADYLICLTQTSAAHYRKKLNISNVDCLYPGSGISKYIGDNGFLKRVKEDNSKIQFIHTGTLSFNRDLTILVNAIYKLGCKDKLRIVLMGQMDAFSQSYVKNYDFIELSGFLKRDELLPYIISSDICLVIQSKEQSGDISKYTIPSKFYDYIGLKKPVFFLGYKNEEVRSMSNEFNFYYADQANFKEVLHELQEIIHDYGKESLKRSNSISVDNVSKKFIKICKSLCD